MNAYYLESDCKRYTVAKTMGPPGTRYLAWRRNPKVGRDTPMPTLLGVYLNPDDAKARCEGER